MERRSPKSRVLAALMAVFFGPMGVHRFYVGKFWSGLLLLVTLGGFGVWWIVDLVMILLGRFTDAEGRLLGPPRPTAERRRLDRGRSRDQLPGTDRDRRPHDATADDGAPLGSLDEDDVLDDEKDDLLADPLEEEFEQLEQEIEERSS